MTPRFGKICTPRLWGALAASWCGSWTVLNGAPAHAQSRWDVTWDAPEGCPQREQVLAAVYDIVGEQIYRSTSLQARGDIRETGDKYRLTLRIDKDGGEQTRTLDAKACKDLLGASAVVLGLHLQRVAAEVPAEPTPTEDAGGDGGEAPSEPDAQGAASSQPDGATAPPVEPQTQTDTTPPESADDTRSSEPRTRYLWLALPRAALVIGSLPKPAATAGLAVGWRQEEWRMWVSGSYQWPQSIAADDPSGVAAVVDRYALELGVSHSWRNDHFEAAPGLLAGVDYLVARGTGAGVTAARASDPAVFVGIGFVFRWLANDWFSVALGAAGEVPLSRPSLQVQSLGEIGQISPAHVRVSLGTEWNF